MPSVTKIPARKSKSIKGARAFKKRDSLGLIIALIVVFAVIAGLILREHYGQRCMVTVETKKNHGCHLDVRIQSLQHDRNKTEIKARVIVKIRGIEEPGGVSVRIQVPGYRAGHYELDGTYDAVKKIYHGSEPDVTLYPVEGSLSEFPLDDLHFKFTVQVLLTPEHVAKPDPFFGRVDLYQRVRGFVFKIKEAQDIHLQGSLAEITFKLERKFYIKVMVICYALLILGYILVVIWRVREANTLVTSLVAFFVSVWSLREGLNSYINGFTTFVDHFFFFLSFALLIIVVLKIFRGEHRPPVEKGERTDPCG